jgi:hypothetical protein
MDGRPCGLMDGRPCGSGGSDAHATRYRLARLEVLKGEVANVSRNELRARQKAADEEDEIDAFMAQMKSKGAADGAKKLKVRSTFEWFDVPRVFTTCAHTPACAWGVGRWTLGVGRTTTKVARWPCKPRRRLNLKLTPKRLCGCMCGPTRVRVHVCGPTCAGA